MKEHKKCHVLGKWCWDHQAKTESGVPGWTRPSKGPGVGYSLWAKNDMTGEGYAEAVIWANGDVHRRKDQTECAVCGVHCQNPVERGFMERRDKYKEIPISRIQES